MSVSGYILALPGKGRIGLVVPSSGAPFLTTTLRTSCGILCHATRALIITDSRANSACHFGAIQRTKASFSSKLSDFLVCLTSSSLIPYAGNSSEWNIPLTPASFAAPANSLPRRGICAPSLSICFTPNFPARSGSETANITAPESNDSLIILEVDPLKRVETSFIFNGIFSATAFATSASTVLSVFLLSSGSCGNCINPLSSLERR